MFLEFIVLFVKNGANIMYQLTVCCNIKPITTVAWRTESLMLRTHELVFSFCLFRWKSFCCNTNRSIVSCVALLRETLTKGIECNQSKFYLTFHVGRGFFDVDEKDLSSRRVWVHGSPQKIQKWLC